MLEDANATIGFKMVSRARLMRSSELGDKLVVILVRDDDEIKGKILSLSVDFSIIFTLQLSPLSLLPSITYLLILEYHVHKQKLLLLGSALPMPIEDDCIMEIENVNHVVMDEFVAWLYSAKQSHQLRGLASIPLLLDIYKFACDHNIKTLEADCYFIMFEYNEFLQELEGIFTAGDDSTRSLISKAVTGWTRYCTGFEEDVPKEDVISIYMFGLKLRCPLLSNVAMDKLPALLKAENSVLSFDDLKDIYLQSAKQSQPRIRLFCAALFHFQRRIYGCENHITDREAEKYFEIPDFRAYYARYERKFSQKYGDEDPDMSLDPRIKGNLGACYFHDHRDGEQCHVVDDDDEEVERDEDEQDFSENEIRVISESPKLRNRQKWHGSLIPPKTFVKDVEEQKKKDEEEAKKSRVEAVKKRAGLNMASSPRNNKRKVDEDPEGDAEMSGAQRRKVTYWGNFVSNNQISPSQCTDYFTEELSFSEGWWTAAFAGLG